MKNQIGKIGICFWLVILLVGTSFVQSQTITTTSLCHLSLGIAKEQPPAYRNIQYDLVEGLQQSGNYKSSLYVQFWVPNGGTKIQGSWSAIVEVIPVFPTQGDTIVFYDGSYHPYSYCNYTVPNPISDSVIKNIPNGKYHIHMKIETEVEVDLWTGTMWSYDHTVYLIQEIWKYNIKFPYDYNENENH